MIAHYTVLCTFRALFKLSCLSLLLLMISTNTQAGKPAKVLVSIKPLHSIISHITSGINQTELLLQQQQSPHDFQLRPSQKRRINQADILFYSSDSIEGFIPALKNTSGALSFIELSRIPTIKTLPLRSFHSHHQHSSAHNIDGHIWLSVENARIIANYVTQMLSKLSPEYAEHYVQNLNALLLQLDELQQQNRQTLNQYQSTPYLVYHDAFQYFEQENNLNNAYFVTTSPQHSPGIKRVKALRQLINDKNIQCVFYEPPSMPALLTTLTENTNLTLAALDPAGVQIPSGKAHYFKLMRQTATTLSTCFHNQ